MSRRIAGTNAWGSGLWSGAVGEAPFNATWSGPTQSARTSLLLTAPDPSDGVSIGPHAGSLRFVVQAVDPTLDGTSLWGTDVWGTGTWSSGLGAWTDISNRIRGLSWKNGVDSPSSRASVGEATLTLNNRDGAASPWASSGPFVGDGSRSWLRTGLIMRFGVTDTFGEINGVDYFWPIFTGKIEDVKEDTSENVDSWVTITLAELSVDYASIPDPQVVTEGHALTEAIFTAILNAGLDYQNDLVVPSSDIATIDGTIGDGHSSMELLQLLADHQHWDVITNGLGQIMIVERRQSLSDTGVTFSNGPTGAELPVVKVNTYSSSERVINEITASSPTGILQTAGNTGSTAQFGVINNRFGFPRNDLLLADADILALIRSVITLRSFDDLGIASISIDMDQDATAWAKMMVFIASKAREGYSFVVRWIHPSGKVFTDVVVIEAQTHSLVGYGDGSTFKWTAELATAHRGALGGS